MLVIWGRNNSVNVQKVLWCCEEMAVGYERIDAGGAFGVVNTPPYRSLNPNGLVPTIDDDGFVLWESHAIVRYLAAKHAAGSLWPQDLKTRAEADRWMDWKHTTFWPAIRTLFMGLIRTAPEKRDLRAIEESRLKTVGGARRGRIAPEERRVPRRRQLYDGRHRARLRHLALDGPADRAPGTAQRAALVRVSDAAAGIPEGGHAPAHLKPHAERAGAGPPSAGVTLRRGARLPAGSRI